MERARGGLAGETGLERERARDREKEERPRGRKKKASSVGPVSFIAGPLHLGFGGVKTSGPSC